MKSYVFDIEADGLQPTKIFCIVAADVEEKKLISFGPSDITKGLDLLSKADKLIGHNILGYDIPVIKALHGIDLSSKKIVDTLVVSRLFNPTREGGHGLEAWGHRLKYNKLDFKEFSFYTEEMLVYCKRDVSLNYKVYGHLKAEAKSFSKQSIDIEHECYKILNAQKKKGFLLDIEKSSILLARLTEKLCEAESEVHKTFRPTETKTLLKPLKTKTGKPSKMASVVGTSKKVRLSDEEFNKVLEFPLKNLIRRDSIPFNLGSRKQIGEYLISFGWKPLEFTPTGQPIVNEKVLEGVKNIKEAQIISEYLLLQKRIAQIRSWLKEVDMDGRIRGYVNSNGTITGRMTHSNPNTAQIPSVRSPYGLECRECWTVPKKYKLVGIDASGLELRMLAHYMEDKEYTNEILNGDIHTTNQKLAGLKSRDQAKTFIYALIYGAGDAKLGTVVEGGRREGETLRRSFLNNLPSFKSFKNRIKREAANGWVRGLDGRKILVRSEHSALNTKLQGAGAIVMKAALIILNEKLKGLDASFVANVHDEWQIEAHQDIADKVGNLGVKSIEEAGNYLGLKCPLTGEYNVGNNWAETH